MNHPDILTMPEQDSAKRRQILDGARQVFLDYGFDGASMNDVARRANVSKGTLYVYFASKQELFAAFIRDEKARQAEQICRLAELNGPIQHCLDRFALELLTALTSPEAIAYTRTMIGAAARHQDLGRIFFETGPNFGAERLSDYFNIQIEKGILEPCNTQEAAFIFLDMMKSGLYTRLLFGIDAAVCPNVLQAQAKRTVQLFMRLYGADQQ